ncbi:MAG: hypothetical protein WC389_16865, partial [Lutibacter sp.]
MSSIFIGNDILSRALCGLLGALMGAVVLFIGVYIVHLIIVPRKIRNENIDKFIQDNAGYASSILGNSTQRKYLSILNTLKAMIEIENNFTDEMISEYKISDKVYKDIRYKINKQTNIPLIENHLPYTIDEYTNKVYDCIKKLNLIILNEMPTKDQIYKMLKIQSVTDEYDF